MDIKDKKLMTKIGQNYETLGTLSYKEANKNILSAVKKAMKQSTSETGREKSKYIYLTDNKSNYTKRPFYLDNLPRQQVRAIFMARKRMLRTKENYKKMYRNAGDAAMKKKRNNISFKNAQQSTTTRKTKVCIQDIFNAPNHKTTHMVSKILNIQNIITQ